MRQKYLGVVVAVMTVLGLAACRGDERATVTGGYGSGVMTGEVVMAESGSPAGVEVSVRGSGQSAVLGADGRFAFAGLAEEGVELSFRRADGVDATLRLDQASGHVTIELAQTTARKSGGRRRSVGGGGTVRVQQFEGVLRSASADQLVLFTSHQEEVTIALGTATVIRKGNATVPAADLAADMRVHVKAQKNDDGSWTALLVIVQNDGGEDGDDNGPNVTEYEGTVVSSAAAELVIFDSHKTEVTFVINGETEIRKGNTTVNPADLAPGTRVHVKATGAADGTKTAVRVTVQNDSGNGGKQEAKLSGSVTATGAGSLTVLSGGVSWTVQTDAATKITKRGAAIALADIAAGDKVKVEGTPSGATTLLAKSIEVQNR